MKIVSLIHCIYQDMGCKGVHAGQPSEKFQVKTGVRQGCLQSPFLSLLVIDWIMRETTRGKNNGIQWTLFELLVQTRLQTFLNTCLRRIFGIRWSDRERNGVLWERAGQEPVSKQILKRE